MSGTLGLHGPFGRSLRSKILLLILLAFAPAVVINVVVGWGIPARSDPRRPGGRLSREAHGPRPRRAHLPDHPPLLRTLAEHYPEVRAQDAPRISALFARGIVLLATGADRSWVCRDASVSALWRAERALFKEKEHLGVTLRSIGDGVITTDGAGRVLLLNERDRGLGLAAVLGIVRGHRGALRVSGETGRGTTFRVFFPAAGQDPARPEGTAAEQPQKAFGGTVLVDDDEETVRFVAKDMLENQGFTVLTAADGQEGMERAAKSPASCKSPTELARSWTNWRRLSKGGSRAPSGRA